MELTYAQEDFISDHRRYEEEYKTLDVTQLLDEVYSDMSEDPDLDLGWIDNLYKVSEKRQHA